MIPIAYPLVLAVILFCMGIVGFLLRKNAIVIFMCLELMFNAANLVFITFANHYQVIDGQVFVVFVMTVAAAEVAVGLALMVTIFRTKQSIDIDQMNSLKG
ncbi:MAG: NADH-quinone oxidoreductase subunit K [Chloroflexi bacterium]|nr:MAG: NADH-quinone oxidoreductase subunit K [Chloroflexota bacterium]MBA4374815.1 NADH-quinone oxidoreductase subunit NuoK [Anaerolinea sp.]